MSHILYNMSAPPRSSVVYKQQQLKKYIAFNPITLAKLLGHEKKTIESLVKDVNGYINAHPNIKKNINKPTGYMVAEYISIDSLADTNSVTQGLAKYSFTNCEDAELMILVFGATVGDLYIPNRPLKIKTSCLNKILLFPEEEVNS